jgi:hypothetical protein
VTLIERCDPVVSVYTLRTICSILYTSQSGQPIMYLVPDRSVAQNLTGPACIRIHSLLVLHRSNRLNLTHSMPSRLGG